jgi:hypothetical protein
MAANQRTAAAAHTATYTFQQPPRSAPTASLAAAPGDAADAANGRYRDPFSGKASQRANIMSDRRVVRGNTYAAQVMPLSAQAEMARAAQDAERMRKRHGKAGASTRGTAGAAAAAAMLDAQRTGTPTAVDGRRHMVMQTEQYLEELKDKVDVVAQEAQTDPMLDRPPTPLYVPLKTGRDAETQIEDGELFDFDTEADPVLDVIVGKTLEQAMLEVMQEEELEAMRQQQVEFEQRRKEEVLEAQRLEAAEKRKYEEKERRKKQEIGRIIRERETREKLSARMFSKAFLSTLESRVLARLEDEGWFHDAVEREVELDFMPWLMDQMDDELERQRKTKALVDELIRAAVLHQE